MNNIQASPARPPIDATQNRSQIPSAEAWSAEDVLRWAAAEFGYEMEIASAFGAEGIVLLEIAAGIVGDLRVFILDTGFLFPETLELIAKVERRHGISVQRITPGITAEQQAELYQAELWSRDPDLCCDLRKIEPLRRKLSRLKAWVTSIRRDQTPARRHIGKVEWDSKFNLVKINPLADWTREMVWAYITKHRLDYNPLHDRNYPSIGCTHCTRAVRPGEHQRAGRWPRFAKQECGLHVNSATSGPSDNAITLSESDAGS